LAVGGVGLAAGADFWVTDLLAALALAVVGAGFFTADVGLAATFFTAEAFLAGVGLGFLAAVLEGALAAVFGGTLAAGLEANLAAGLETGLTEGLAFTADWGGAFLATALTGLAGVAALPAFWATGLALLTAAPFLVLAVDMQGLLRCWPPPMGGLTACWIGVQPRSGSLVHPGLPPKLRLLPSVGRARL